MYHFHARVLSWLFTRKLVIVAVDQKAYLTPYHLKHRPHKYVSLFEFSKPQRWVIVRFWPVGKLSQFSEILLEKLRFSQPEGVARCAIYTHGFALSWPQSSPDDFWDIYAGNAVKHKHLTFLFLMFRIFITVARFCGKMDEDPGGGELSLRRCHPLISDLVCVAGSVSEYKSHHALWEGLFRLPSW